MRHVAIISLFFILFQWKFFCLSWFGKWGTSIRL